MTNEDNMETFEELMQKLETIVEKLEKGGLSLEDSTQIYEEGMKVAVDVTKRLTESELKISNIRERYQEIFEEIEDACSLNLRQIIFKDSNNLLNQPNYTQVSIFASSL